jgi:hypothetical protein
MFTLIELQQRGYEKQYRRQLRYQEGYIYPPNRIQGIRHIMVMFS